MIKRCTWRPHAALVVFGELGRGDKKEDDIIPVLLAATLWTPKEREASSLGYLWTLTDLLQTQIDLVT